MIKKEILINLISEKIEVMSEAQLKEVDKFIKEELKMKNYSIQIMQSELNK